VSKSHSQGQRLEEAKTINKSISALGNVVAALIDNGASFVPFRDSKLTRLLTDSLGGNAKTVICANAGPPLANYDETHSTLLFATRAMRVRNTVRVNTVGGFKTGEKAAHHLRDSMLRASFDPYGRSHTRSSAIPTMDGSPYSSQQSDTETEPSPSAERSVDPTYQEMVEEVQRLRAENLVLRGPQLGEQALVNKFTGVIQHLQAEITAQNEAIEGLVEAMLSIPIIKSKVEARLEHDISQDA